ncbi:hypothetical protein [Roseibium sp.]|uniref:hypothetical protein n=1 Tax=Roseibium sp. TaxID=1936156 RepID=UPI003A97400A
MNVLSAIRFVVLGAIFAMAQLISVPVSASSWNETIREVKKKAAEYGDRGRALGGLPLGSAYGTFRMDEHQCVILGYMLDKKHVITQLDVPTKPELVTGDDYILEATSLHNWAFKADYLKAKPTEFKIKLWNRECVGRFGIPADARIEEAHKDAF